MPNYNFKGLKERLFCKLHAEKGMVNITHKLCSSCEMTSGWINGYCSPCFYFQNPEHVKTRNHKTRENTFTQPLKDIYPDAILDKKVHGGCSLKRLLDLLTHSIIVEIDENQHQGYSCESKRMMTLFNDLGQRPLVMLRLNPDSYTKNGKRTASAFSLSKNTGQISPKPKEFNLRFQTLLDTIDQFKEQPGKEITIVELFYNQ